MSIKIHFDEVIAVSTLDMVDRAIMLYSKSYIKCGFLAKRIENGGTHFSIESDVEGCEIVDVVRYLTQLCGIDGGGTLRKAIRFIELPNFREEKILLVKPSITGYSITTVDEMLSLYERGENPELLHWEYV